MTRKPRFNLPGIPQHVKQRDNSRKSYFCAKAKTIIVRSYSINNTE
jgi:hypothetical protein